MILFFIEYAYNNIKKNDWINNTRESMILQE